MTEARKEAERSVAKVNGLQKEKEELQSSLGSLRTRMKEESQEADAIQRKLIAELKQLRDELASSQGEVATRDKLIARIEVQVKNGKDKISELEEELRTLRGMMGSRDEADGLRAKVQSLQSSNSDLKEKLTVANSEKAALENEVSGMRKRWEGREREWRQEVERTEAEHQKERTSFTERVKILEGRSSEWDKGREELLLLRERLKEVEKEGKHASSKELDIKVLKEQIASLQQALQLQQQEHDKVNSRCVDLEAKLLAVTRRADAADEKLMQIEGNREELRAIENEFKLKMKTLYDKRVKELEAVQRELETSKDEGKGSQARPATASRRR
mmetsp:Transcript_8763/g.19887  ORF Transcript_8763/g.19887 Transcript_8763/m.19887 type:complete len:331 (+) Transcript_8763:1495-2487(+)